jgi:sulfate permease, SulP family
MPGKYNASALRGDLFGGLTAGIIALPLALAFGVASGAGAAAGLYGAAALGFFAALFGGTSTQISGPTGPMTVVTAAAIASFSGDFASVCTVIILAGLLQIVFGALRLGVFVRFIPYPVISGFMSGIGVIILLLQIQPILGGPALDSPLAALAGLPEALRQMNPYSLGLAAASMAIVFLTPPRISRVVPSPLIALVVLSLAAHYFSFPTASIGAIPAGFPELRLPQPQLAQWSRMASLALALAVLGSIDSLLTSIVADSMTRKRHHSNKELIGQGLGNMAAGLFGGLPGAGATMRTVVNIKAGGTTRVSGIVHALFLLAVIMGLGPLTSVIPLPVLSGILVKVGVDILDYRLLRLVRKAPKQDLLVMLAVFGTTVFVDLIVAVGVGVALASLFLTYRIARQTQIRITEASGRTDAAQGAFDPRIRVIGIHGAFFFGSSALMQDKVDRMLGTRIVVVDCMEVPFMDISAVFALSEMIEKLQDAGVRVFLAISERQRDSLDAYGIRELVGEDNLFLSRGSALQVAQITIEDEDKQDRPTPAPKIGKPAGVAC